MKNSPLPITSPCRPSRGDRARPRTRSHRRRQHTRRLLEAPRNLGSKVAPSTSEDGLTASPSSFEKMSSPALGDSPGSTVRRQASTAGAANGSCQTEGRQGVGAASRRVSLWKAEDTSARPGNHIAQNYRRFLPDDLRTPRSSFVRVPSLLALESKTRRPPSPRAASASSLSAPWHPTHSRALGTKLGRTTDAFCQTARRHPARNPRRRTRRDLDRNAVATLEQFEVRA